MLEISELKEKKLPELQDLAKDLGVPKYRTLKKLDLVYQILDYQAANPAAVQKLIPAAVEGSGQNNQNDPATVKAPKNEERRQNNRPDKDRKPRHQKAPQAHTKPNVEAKDDKDVETPKQQTNPPQDSVKIRIHRTIKTKNQVMIRTVVMGGQKTTTKTTTINDKDIRTKTNVLIIKIRTTATAIQEIVTENLITNLMESSRVKAS